MHTIARRIDLDLAAIMLNLQFLHISRVIWSQPAGLLLLFGPILAFGLGLVLLKRLIGLGKIGCILVRQATTHWGYPEVHSRRIFWVMQHDTFPFDDICAAALPALVAMPAATIMETAALLKRLRLVIAVLISLRNILPPRGIFILLYNIYLGKPDYLYDLGISIIIHLNRSNTRLCRLFSFLSEARVVAITQAPTLHLKFTNRSHNYHNCG